MDTCYEKGRIIDAECCYDSGRFFMGRLPGCLPRLFTVRFTAPVDYTTGDVVVVDDKELPIRTPGMTSATSGLFKAGAVMHCDIDLDRKLAFFWQSGDGPGGVIPNLSYEEQFAGFYDELGKKVYFKLVDMGNGIDGPATQQEKYIDPQIQNLDRVIDLHVRRDAGSGVVFNASSSRTVSVYYGFADGKICLVQDNASTADHTMQAKIYYTRTDR